MKYKDDTNKYSKPLAILLCVGVLAGLIYLSSLNLTKAEEFSKGVEPHISFMFTEKKPKLSGWFQQSPEDYVKAAVDRLPADLASRGEGIMWVKLIFKLKPETCKGLMRFSNLNFNKYPNSTRSLLLQYCDNSYWGNFYFN